MSKAIHNPELPQAYWQADRELRVRQSKIGCGLAMLLMPAGISLDWFVYPAKVLPFLEARLVCDAGLAVILGLLFTKIGRRCISVLGIAWALLPAFCIAWMIFRSEGALSPYYAGLNLVMIGVSLFMPWTFGEVLLTCTLTLGLYLAAAAGQAGGVLHQSLFFNNLYFLVLTALICVMTSYFTAGRRFAEFRLRHELRMKNEELAGSYNRLAQMDRIKSEFFANISHELRTPLTLIIGPVEEVLFRPGLTEAAREALELARQNALRLLQLINNVLDIVRLEEGGIQLRLETMDLAQFIPAMADSVRHVARLKGLTLYLEDGLGGDALAAEPAARAPLLVEADAGCMERVTVNILTNAIKFTPAGGKVVLRWGRAATTEGARAVVEVEDSGIGISPGEMPHIFDRFHQADRSSSRRFRGVGIGLALARDLVQKHAGRLTARSTLGQGTTLRMELPLHAGMTAAGNVPGPAPNDSADPYAEIYRSAERTVPLDLSGQSGDLPVVGSGSRAILVIDDEPDMRRFLVTTLAERYKVFQAADGESGLAIALKYNPALIVLDFMLPGIDGLEVCRRLKSEPATRDIKIILLTARTDERSKIDALEQGADDFLTKPFSTIEVRTRLANLLRSAELEDRLRSRNLDLEQALAKLKETEVQLVQSEKMNALGKLSAGLLHEIQNPLNYTLMALELADGRVPDSEIEMKEYLSDISEGIGRVRDVISDLRTFAHSSGEIRHERFSLAEALTSAVRLVSHELKEVALDRSGVGAEHFIGSKTQVIHVLMNLLVNAAQASARNPAGRAPRIIVTAARQGGRVQVHVLDNGKGIKAVHLSRVFEPFFTTKEVGQGMGLGLSICHTIVRNHGGSITIRSEENEYTDVAFDLPSDDPPAGEQIRGQKAGVDGSGLVLNDGDFEVEGVSTLGGSEAPVGLAQSTTAGKEL